MAQQLKLDNHLKQSKVTLMKYSVRNTLNLASLLSIIFLFIMGCATLNPGANAFIVRVEQGQSIAGTTFDLVLNLDNDARPFWRTNAPAFHQFCEWLRAPVVYSNAPLQRVLAMQANVQDLKVAYKATRDAGNSNNLFLAWTVLDTAIGQAGAWSMIVTNKIHP